MVVMSTVSNGKGNFGYNALTGEYEKDMFKAGIIDPLKVVKNAIENSVSVASLILTTECAISNDKKEEL
jgi:chaperonin GroEL